MLTLKDYVNWGITHCDKTGSAEGVPLVMEKCVKNKKMKQLEVYGNSIQNGTPSPENPIEVESVGELADNGKYKVPIIINNEITQTLYLNEPLRKIGDYADYIDFKNGKVVRYVRTLSVKNGSWGMRTSADGEYSYFVVNGLGTGWRGLILSPIYKLYIFIIICYTI